MLKTDSFRVFKKLYMLTIISFLNKQLQMSSLPFEATTDKKLQK